MPIVFLKQQSERNSEAWTTFRLQVFSYFQGHSIANVGLSCTFVFLVCHTHTTVCMHRVQVKKIRAHQAGSMKMTISVIFWIITSLSLPTWGGNQMIFFECLISILIILDYSQPHYNQILTSQQRTT